MKVRFPKDDKWFTDVDYAFQEAIGNLSNWEYGGASTQEEYDRQMAAAKFVVRQIERLQDRVFKIARSKRCEKLSKR